MNGFKMIKCVVTAAILMFVFCSDSEKDGTKIVKPDDFLGEIDVDYNNAILKPDGTLWTWGYNYSGQLGNGTLEGSLIPQKVKSLKNVISIEFIEGAAYVLDGMGNIWFWGNRLIWMEPPGMDTTVVIPTKIASLPGAVQIQVRGPSVYILKNDGTIWHSSWNHYSPTGRLTFENVPGFSQIKRLSGALTLRSDGTLQEYGDLPSEEGGLDENMIVDSVVMVQNSFRLHTIILKTDGTVWAWGKRSSWGDTPKPGENKDLLMSEPCKVSNLEDIVSISCSYNNKNLALKKDGTVWYWDVGLNEKDEFYPPVCLEGIDDVVLIHASARGNFIFMKSDGSYWSYDLEYRRALKMEF